MNPDNRGPGCPVCDAEASYDYSGRDLMFDHYERFDYYSCPVCQVVFMHPMPGEEKISSFYPPDYSVFDQKSQVRRISPLKKALFRARLGYNKLRVPLGYRFLAFLAAPFYSLDKPFFVEGGRLLDVGCGNGRYLGTMRTLGWDVQGVELSEDGHRACMNAGLNVFHGDLHTAAFENDSFDVITVRHVIEHISTPKPLIAELARILKPNGKLMIETPNSDSLGRAFLGPKWFANDVPRHLLLFSRENLVKLASDNGLTLKDCWFDTTPKILLKSIDYILPGRGRPSNKMRWKRFLARFYVLAARISGRGDTIHTVFEKR